MFLVDHVILLGGALLIVGIVSSTFSARLGLPVLVLFLAVGMLAGEDGFGRIEFDNFVTAHAIGTVALAIIAGDHLFVIVRADSRAALDAALGIGR